MDARRPARAALLLVAGLAVLAAGCTTVGGATGATEHRSAPPAGRRHRAMSSWVGPVTADPGRALVALSCPARGRCVAIDANGAAVVEHGRTWSPPVPGVAPASSVPAVGELSCPSTTWCLAIHSPDEVVTWTAGGGRSGSGSWAPPVVLGGAQHLQAVACAAAGTCVAVDGVGDGYVLDGATWSSQLNAWGGATDISCTGSSSCVAAMGGMATWDGGSWSRPVDVDPAGMVTAVSCGAPTFCVAVDTSGREVTWNGTAWSPPQSILPSPAATPASASVPSPTDVSCAGPSWCAAVGGNRVTVWDGRRWSKPVALGLGFPLAAVACPSPGTCTVADARGEVWAR